MTSSPDDSSKMVVPLEIDKKIHMTIKLYCVKTGITMKEFFEPYSKQLEAQLLIRASEITEMEKQAERQRQKEEEDQKIAAEYPLQVPGIEVESPIST